MLQLLLFSYFRLVPRRAGLLGAALLNLLLLAAPGRAQQLPPSPDSVALVAAIVPPLAAAPPATPATSVPATQPGAGSELTGNAGGRPDTARVLSLAAYSPAGRYELGRADARQFYKPAKGVFWGTLAGTVGLPVVGGVAAVGAVAVRSPKPEKLHAPTPRFLLDDDYHKGYVKQAKSAKLNKGLGGFGAGVGVLFVAYAVLAEIMANALNIHFNMY